MAKDFDSALKAANTRLKTAKVRVTLRTRRDSIFLRATLPPKPGSNHLEPQQYDLRTGLPASLDGLKRAENEAKLLGSQMALKTFRWEDWLDITPNNERKGAEAIEAFKKHWFSTHQITEATWERHWLKVFQHLPQDKVLTPEMLLTVALDSQPDSRKRKRSSRMLQRLAEFLNLEIDLKAYQGHYSQPEKARDLPSDELISTWRDKIPNQNWQWVFGMLATFGLRPHEAWFCEFEDPLTLRVLDGKTAERVASALYPDWVKKWDLENIQRPKLSCQTFQQYGERCCRQFNRYKVPFVPYDLRHAWALRAALKFRLPETVAAKLMGHSVAVHHKTYHRWLSAIEQRQAYMDAMALWAGL